MTLVCPIRDQPGASANYAQVQLRTSPKLQDKGSGAAAWLSTCYVPSIRVGILPPVTPSGQYYWTHFPDPESGASKRVLGLEKGGVGGVSVLELHLAPRPAVYL